MNEVVVGVLTAAAIASCGMLGYRWGAPRALRAVLIVFTAWTAGGSIAVAMFALGAFGPLGLVTPALVGLFVLVVTGLVGRRVWTTPERSRPLAGAALGSVLGVFVAALVWMCAALLQGLASEPREKADAPEERGVFEEIVRTANRGFVRHLPVIGPLGDEVEATVAIMNASEEQRRRIAEKREWQELAELESYQALARDDELARDLNEFREGSLLALYRIQRNPRFLAFFEEERVQALIPGLRPSELVKELN